MTSFSEAAAGARRTPPTARITDTRRRNVHAMFNLLFRHGPTSRADLMRRSGLTAPTVTAVVSDLLAARVIVDTGATTVVGPGKPASLLALNLDSAVVLALDLGDEDHPVAAAVGLDGSIRWRQELSPAEVASSQALARVCVQLMQRCGECVVVGVGVGISALVDGSGTLVSRSCVGDAGLPLAAELTEALNLPVHVANDVNAETVAVRLFRGIDAHNLLLISVRNGVGAGLVIGDSLVEGETFAAGELGHITADPAGPPCDCGRRGCLEVYLNPRGAADPSQDRPSATVTGTLLGAQLAPLIGVMDLNTVAVVGPPEVVSPEMLAAAAAEADRRTLRGVNLPLRLLPITDDEDLVLIGAAGVVLAQQLGLR